LPLSKDGLLTDKKPPTDENATQGKERFVNVGTLLVADTQSAKTGSARRKFVRRPIAIDPARCRVAHREQGQDAASTQALPD